MWPNPQFPADLVAFTEEIFNVKLHFLCSVKRVKYCIQQLAINIFIPWYMSRLLITFFCLLLFFWVFCPVNATMVCARENVCILTFPAYVRVLYSLRSGARLRAVETSLSLL